MRHSSLFLDELCVGKDFPQENKNEQGQKMEIFTPKSSCRCETNQSLIDQAAKHDVWLGLSASGTGVERVPVSGGAGHWGWV